MTWHVIDWSHANLNALWEITMQVDEKTYEEIAAIIHSDESPVGIDAKKTHILILQHLQEISERLKKVEAEIESIRDNQ